MIGRTLSRYRLVESLGSGGMGDVYRAEDTRLGRAVAVKVLRAKLADDLSARARFEREARAVAVLSHPNILAIHDFGVDEDVVFAVMELLEGETLREEMQHTGPFEVSHALSRALPIATGLAAAHEKNIIHRDLKPANVFVGRDGQIKILDFGLVKMVGPTGPEEASLSTQPPQEETQSGLLLGTAGYLSPEQAKGGWVDARADLFSLGIMIHEMIVGENPFRRETAIATVGAILHEEPPPLAREGTDMPPALAQLVRECLDKNAELRPGSAGEVIRRLKACREEETSSISVAREGHAIDSLAVLPFVNEGEDPDTDFLSDGLAESLINNLSQLPRLRVMARSSVIQHRDKDANPSEIARKLGVRAVLTGRLRQRDDTLVIRAELVDTTDGRRLWGGRFNRNAADLLIIEDEIAKEIADNLRFPLTGEERGRIAKKHTTSSEAYELYLRGRHVWNTWKTPEGMRTAISFFERALEADPLYARAYAGLSDSYNVLGNIKSLPPEEAYPRSQTVARQGLAIDEEIAELHTSLGFSLRHWDWDWQASEREYQRAIELNPGYALTYRWYGQLLAGLGRHDEAVATSKRSVELDPLSLLIRGALGDVLFYARRYEEAIELYRETLEVDSGFIAGHTDLARALEMSGRYEEALEEFDIAERLAPKGPMVPSSGRAHVYAQMGRREDALSILDRIQERAKTTYVSPYGIASIYACLKEVDTSLEWLERAYEMHDETMAWVKVHPRLDPVRSHERYRVILEKMRLT